MRFHFRRWWPAGRAAALVFGSVGLSNNKLLHSPSFDFVTLCVSACFSLLCRSVSCLLSDPPINWVISSPKIATASAAAAADVIGVCIVFVRASLIFSLLCRSVSAFQPLLPPGGTFTPLCGESAKYANIAHGNGQI